MVEQKVSKVVTVRIDARLFAQTGRTKKWERLKRSQRRLALSHRHCAARHCEIEEKRIFKISARIFHIQSGKT
jgi:hypothetical protein